MHSNSAEADAVQQREPYDRFRVSPADPSTLRCEDVQRVLARLAESSAGRLKVEQFAESYEGRPISLATIGSGPRRVLLWSQMHGDEPTHTAVLLDLLSFLTHWQNDPAAAQILAGTTLHALPMLCPDGAAAGTRYNAQHIDVNRDALRLESPEGRALLKAVETLRPEFGFNLHNQNARTAIGIPPRPAAVALMAPPLDANLSENAQIRAAKQLAVCFAEAVQSRAAGMIARYEADYMPWSFGERVQALGVVTLLVEAGGWPGTDPTPIVELHFDGLAATLRAIASGDYRHADPRVYDQLPRANELKLYDAVISGAHLLDVDCSAPVRADLGINHSQGHRLALSHRPDGKIVDLGDLGTSTGKVVIDATGCLVLPGRIAILHDWAPGTPLEPRRVDQLLAQGVTTVLGCIDTAQRDAREFVAMPMELPLNWGFVSADNIGAAPRPANTFAEIADQTWRDYKQFGLDAARAKIRRDCVADLAIYKSGRSQGQPGDVRQVVVAGETVWVDGERTGRNPGTFLQCEGGSRGC